MARTPRNYTHTPLYSCRLNRNYPSEEPIAEWLDNAIADNIASGGKGFREVLTNLVQREIRRKSKTPPALPIESRLERIVVTALNARLDELAQLILSRSFLGGAVQQNGGEAGGVYSTEDVTGIIDKSDLAALMNELNGEYD